MLLSIRPVQELANNRIDLIVLAIDSRLPLTRQIGYAALIASQEIDGTWSLATKSVASLQDFVAAVPMVRDPALRAALYPKVKTLLAGLPPELAKTVPDGNPVVGRYVRIELPGKQRTLTLAEVEVFSDGANVARIG